MKIWTKEGRLLLNLGSANQNAPVQSNIPFNMPTHLSVASNGDLFGSDGYRNSAVHCFDPEGKLKYSFGSHGTGEGQFNCIHSLYVDREDNDKIYVADRYNCCVQIFTSEGEFIGRWTGLHMPNHVRKGPDGNFYVAELRHRISILSPKGEMLCHWGDDAPAEEKGRLAGYGVDSLGLPDSPSWDKTILADGFAMADGVVKVDPGAGMFNAPHGIAVDSEGKHLRGRGLGSRDEPGQRPTNVPEVQKSQKLKNVPGVTWEKPEGAGHRPASLLSRDYRRVY